VGAVRDWLFGTVDTAPPVSAVSAAAGRVALSPTSRIATTGWGVGGEFLAPVEWAPPLLPWWDRASAMTIPTISRSRDLICSAVGALPFTLLRVDFSSDPPVEQIQPPAAWMNRPDPSKTRQWILAWTTDDLFFYGVAYWRIVARFAAPNDWPAAFERILPGDLTVHDDGTVTILGAPVDPRDIVEFLSPIEGILTNGFRAISIALQLDAAAERFASNEVPAGVLEEQDGGEDLSEEDLEHLAATFTEARRTNTTAATNKYIRYREVNVNAEAMQLVQGRTHQALELARLANVPPYLVGAPAGTGMTYQNAEQARSDLIDFGALPYIGCLEQTLGGPNVTPRGQAVRLMTDAWLRSPFTAGGGDPGPASDAAAVGDDSDLARAYNVAEAAA
jgi:hypothetical protein